MVCERTECADGELESRLAEREKLWVKVVCGSTYMLSNRVVSNSLQPDGL